MISEQDVCIVSSLGLLLFQQRARKHYIFSLPFSIFLIIVQIFNHKLSSRSKTLCGFNSRCDNPMPQKAFVDAISYIHLSIAHRGAMCSWHAIISCLSRSWVNAVNSLEIKLMSSIKTALIKGIYLGAPAAYHCKVASFFPHGETFDILLVLLIEDIDPIVFKILWIR